MKVKVENSNYDQNSLHSKELQKFLNKVKGVIMIPRDKTMEYSMLCLLLRQDQYANFKDYNIHKTIIDLLDDKYPILSIRLDDNSNLFGLSIIDKESGLKFRLPGQLIDNALLTFLKARNYDEKICLMIGFFNGDNLAFDNDIKSNVLLILDGFVVE